MRTITQAKTWWKLSFLGGFAVFLLAAGSILLQAPKVYASCDNVNIIHCGLSGSGQQGYINSLKHHWDTSKDDLGRTDIRKILRWANWTDNMVSGANTSNTKLGVLHSKTGNIVVDGRVVATDTRMSARFTKGAGFNQIAPGVWARAITTDAAEKTYQVLIHFGADGEADAGIAIDCGNPIRFTPKPAPKPVAKCVGLDVAALDKDKLMYSFSARARVENASLTGGNFDFGDGNKDSGKVKGNTLSASHRYAVGGTYTIVATLKFSAYNKTLTDTCQTKLTLSVPPPSVPYYSCVSLSGSILDQDTYSYQFVATMDYGNGATFVSGDFDFGDGNTQTDVESTDGKTISADHTYAQAGTYHALATLHFSVNGGIVTAPACKAFVTPTTPPTPECKPGIPVGDIRCNPCEYDASITADDERCVAPVTTLPNTGAGNVVAIASAALVGGFLWYRHVLFKRHKAAYAAADFGSSPLPLGEPLESDTPLAGTPLESQTHPRRLSLRRRRQF